LEINFIIPNEYDNIIKKIFYDIKLENANVSIENDEVFLENGESLFDKDNYCFKNFIKYIEEKRYYIVFLNMNISFIDSKNSKKYTISLDIIDSIFVQLKCDNQKIFDKIIYNISNNKFIIKE